MGSKTFTIEEANRLIPDLSRLFSKINEIRIKIGLIKESMNYAWQAKPEFPESQQKLAEKIQTLSQEVKKYVAEMQTVGCIVKDLDNYLVDFYSTVDGKPAFLCWKYGEERISYWHDVQAGNRNRIPLNPIRQEMNRI